MNESTDTMLDYCRAVHTKSDAPRYFPDSPPFRETFVLGMPPPCSGCCWKYYDMYREDMDAEDYALGIWRTFKEPFDPPLKGEWCGCTEFPVRPCYDEGKVRALASAYYVRWEKRREIEKKMDRKFEEAMAAIRGAPFYKRPFLMLRAKLFGIEIREGQSTTHYFV